MATAPEVAVMVPWSESTVRAQLEKAYQKGWLARGGMQRPVRYQFLREFLEEDTLLVRALSLADGSWRRGRRQSLADAFGRPR